jgi:hypothetical protein
MIFFSLTSSLIIACGIFFYKRDLIPLNMINIGYEIIHFVSLCQIQMNKIKNKLSPYFDMIKIYLTNNDQYIQVKIINKSGIIDCEESMLSRFIKIPSLDLTNYHVDFNNYQSPSNNLQNDVYQCYLNSRWYNISSVFNKEKHMGIIVQNNKECTEIFYEQIPRTLNYKLSNIKFISVDIEYKNNNYKIELKNDITNYYIVNNSLNQNFVKYYLVNKLNITILDDEHFDYTVNIIDQNVNFITLLPNQSLIFNENDYSIVSNNFKQE